MQEVVALDAMRVAIQLVVARRAPHIGGDAVLREYLLRLHDLIQDRA